MSSVRIIQARPIHYARTHIRVDILQCATAGSTAKIPSREGSRANCWARIETGAAEARHRFLTRIEPYAEGAHHRVARNTPSCNRLSGSSVQKKKNSMP